MRNPPILFLDTETLGLDVLAPIWEIAAVLIDEDGHERRGLEIMVRHEPGDWVDKLPASFREDYLDRYNREYALPAEDAVRRVANLVAGGVHIAGSNPGFDMERLERLAARAEYPESPFGWHYHPIDVPTFAHGWLCGRGVYPAPPWRSDFITQACGIDITQHARHTAMGDVSWCLALWHHVTGYQR